MKRMWIGIAVILLASMAFSQNATPSLSTADRVAIVVLEQRKQAAKKDFDEAQQGELSVLREWNAAHPGFHLNEQTFVPEPDAKPVGKTEAKPEVKKEVVPASQSGKTTKQETSK